MIILIDMGPRRPTAGAEKAPPPRVAPAGGWGREGRAPSAPRRAEAAAAGCARAASAARGGSTARDLMLSCPRDITLWRRQLCPQIPRLTATRCSIQSELWCGEVFCPARHSVQHRYASSVRLQYPHPCPLRRPELFHPRLGLERTPGSAGREAAWAPGPALQRHRAVLLNDCPDPGVARPLGGAGSGLWFSLPGTCHVICRGLRGLINFSCDLKRGPKAGERQRRFWARLPANAGPSRSGSAAAAPPAAGRGRGLWSALVPG